MSAVLRRSHSECNEESAFPAAGEHEKQIPRSARNDYPALFAMSVNNAGYVRETELVEAEQKLGAIDLTVTLADDLPCWWPAGGYPYHLWQYKKEGCIREFVIVGEHAGTHWDAPAHFSPPLDTGLPAASIHGTVTAEKVPPWQLAGPAAVIDVTSLLDQAEPGVSPLIKPEHVRTWEAENRPLRPGDVVIFHSGYQDTYYRPMPDGLRLSQQPLTKSAPAWPGPEPSTISYLAERGSLAVCTTAPSMGPLPREVDLQTHQLGGRSGVVFVESLVGARSLPPGGSFVAILGPKYVGGSGGPARVIAIPRGEVAEQLALAVQNKRVVDLSLPVGEELPVVWPGRTLGDYDVPYICRTMSDWTSPTPALSKLQFMDVRTGTHVAIPSHVYPSGGEEHVDVGRSGLTVDQIPLDDLVGPARVVDVRGVVGSTSAREWPKSPVIEMDAIRDHESHHGPLQVGEIVLFYSGHGDRLFRAKPHGEGYMAAPLAGRQEGWPSPSVEVIRYLADKGVRTVGSDAPRLGAVTTREAARLYSTAAAAGLLVVEGLLNLGQLPPRGSYFLCGPLKLWGAHAAPAGAMGLIP